MGGNLGVSTPGGETNTVCVTGDLQARENAISVVFAFHGANHDAIPAVVGGDTGIKTFKG
jgi:hypothetical protein